MVRTLPRRRRTKVHSTLAFLVSRTVNSHTKSPHLSENDFKKWTKRVTPRKGDLLFSHEESHETSSGEVCPITEPTLELPHHLRRNRRALAARQVAAGRFYSGTSPRHRHRSLRSNHHRTAGQCRRRRGAHAQNRGQDPPTGSHNRSQNRQPARLHPHR